MALAHGFLGEGKPWAEAHGLQHWSSFAVYLTKQFADSLNERGLLKAANALRSDAHGTRLTRHGGKDSVVDGPFTESKEMVGGFFLVDCATRDEAIAIARECPAAAGATVEVREVGTCFEDLG